MSYCPGILNKLLLSYFVTRVWKSRRRGRSGKCWSEWIEVSQSRIPGKELKKMWLSCGILVRDEGARARNVDRHGWPRKGAWVLDSNSLQKTVRPGYALSLVWVGLSPMGPTCRSGKAFVIAYAWVWKLIQDSDLKPQSSINSISLLEFNKLLLFPLD